MSSDSGVISSSVEAQVSSGSYFFVVVFLSLFFGGWRPVVRSLTTIFRGLHTGARERKEGIYSCDETPDRHRKMGRMCQSPSQRCSQTSAPTMPRDVFKAKYVEEALLGVGGYGSVFAGHRRHDNLPVAIKHIHHDGKIPTSFDENYNMVPLEVALMLRLKPASGGTSAAVTLLDWYDLKDELILILERPVPCVDLHNFVDSTGSALREGEAKIIIKQLVDALIEIHSKGVFHRDIKPDNILCETGPGGPRIRIIDFGCGAFLNEMYTTPQGTGLYSSPEWFTHRLYRAEPATVWHIGVVLFLILHRTLPFEDTTAIVHGKIRVRHNLSSDCRDLLLSCFNKDPAARPSLERLKHHPWLM